MKKELESLFVDFVEPKKCTTLTLYLSECIYYGQMLIDRNQVIRDAKDIQLTVVLQRPSHALFSQVPEVENG